MKYVLWLAFLIPFYVSAESYPSCEIKETGKLALFSDQPSETIEVLIKGAPCHKANLQLMIKSSDNKTLYSYQAPFTRHTDVPWNVSDLDLIAATVASDMISEDKVQSCDSLILPEKYVENPKYLISELEYSEFKKKKCKFLTHQVHSETWKEVVFVNADESAVSAAQYEFQ